MVSNTHKLTFFINHLTYENIYIELVELFRLHQECIGVGKQLSKIAFLAVNKEEAKSSPCIRKNSSKQLSLFLGKVCQTKALLVSCMIK